MSTQDATQDKKLNEELDDASALDHSSLKEEAGSVTGMTSIVESTRHGDEVGDIKEEGKKEEKEGDQGEKDQREKAEVKLPEKEEEKNKSSDGGARERRVVSITCLFRSSISYLNLDFILCKTLQRASSCAAILHCFFVSSSPFVHSAHIHKSKKSPVLLFPINKRDASKDSVLRC